MILAVDFDDTLQIGGQPNLLLINQLRAAQKRGDVLILWTCRDGRRLEEAVQWCAKQGLVFNYVNENCPQAVRMLGHNPRKVYADVYIDDKSMK